jgi:hypothetical protein
VSAATGLDAAAQARVDDALAADDVTELLSPLAAAQADLRADHAGLADQIDTLTRQTDQVRQDTQDRRD